jgi:ATP-binding cassette subfamily C exporter for protease/lipase
LLQRAVALVGLQPLLNGWVDGLDTRLGDEGEFLSGGQRQRVALARAVYGQPRLVVLDEPNANLDAEGDQSLNETLGRLKAAGCTLVVVSHRTSVLPVADRILALRDGVLAAFGPRDEVLAALQAPTTVAAAAAPATPSRQGERAAS